MIVDGLRADLVTPETTPQLAAIAAHSCVFAQQHSVFPTATRVNSASIATGCYPAQHGLAGNAIALDEGAGLQPVSVGSAEFRDRWRRATGRTLHRPTLAERLRRHGGGVIYSNSSAGAAHMQDPDSHGWLYHRSGSFAPGMQPIVDERHLDVSYDAAGDVVTTQRCCDALLNGPGHPLTLLWICEPDHSQHALELGSPEHLAVLAGADRCVGQMAATVAELRGRGDEVLFILASDHGHETVSEVVPVTDLLVEAGFKQDLHSSDVVMASSGMGGLIYLAESAQPLCRPIAEWLRGQRWIDRVYAGAELRRIGQRHDNGLAIAFGMAKRNEPNRFGIHGLGAVAADAFMPNDAIGLGQHGGFGLYESHPMLMISGGDFTAGQVATPSSTIDIAPTILAFLGLPADAMDGRALAPA
jgi:arylsulfatase A-like enzyme